MYKSLLFQIGRFFLVIGSLIGGYFLLKHALFILYPFLIAFILSFLMNPFVTYVERKFRFPRILATILIIFTILLLFIGSLVILIVKFIEGTAYLADKLPVHFKTFVTLVENIINVKLVPFYHKLNSLFVTLDPNQKTMITDYVEQITSDIAASGATILQSVFIKLSIMVTQMPSSITIFIITLLATFLITKDWPKIQHKVIEKLPAFANLLSRNVFLHFKEAMGGYIKAQFILIAITGCIIFICLSILRIEHVLTITLLATIADLLPFIGTGIIFVPWIAYLFITENYAMTINLLLIYMFIIISRQIIEPKVISANIGLHPLSALFALFIGIQLWGLQGIIFAPILLILLKALQQAGVPEHIWKFIKG